MNIYFIHGFLGVANDWQTLEAEMREFLPDHCHFYAMNLWHNIKDLSTDKMFYSWADQFAENLEGEDNWLIGYSMGGRLLLHLPPAAFPRVKALTLVSSHLGLEDPQDREVRLEQDQFWAQKFLNEPWNQLMADWSSQKVFENDRIRALRSEQQFFRSSLAKALEGWSLGRQKSFWDEKFPFPVQYIYGQRDEKFAAIAQQIRLRCPEIRVQGIAEAGHSIPITNPLELAQELKIFFKSFSPP